MHARPVETRAALFREPGAPASAETIDLAGALELRGPITRSYRLDEINDGYADLAAGRNSRGVIVSDP